MIENYFKIAWRNLKKNKFYSFISVFGLALGMSCSFLIWLWVQDELSFNRFYPEEEDVYFIRRNGSFNGDVFSSTVTPAPLAAVLKQDVPEVAYSVRFSWDFHSLISVGEISGKENGLYASDDLFEVFRLPVVEGDPAAALASPTHIVISRRLAEKYFGEASAVGKTLRLNNEKNYLVGAVIEDIPANSSLQLDWVVNFSEIEADWMHWGNNTFFTFVRLHPHADRAAAEANMKSIYPRYTDANNDSYPILQPLEDLHLYTRYENGVPAGGRIDYVRIFMSVAFFILLIACINFMNLATARSSLRSREVGVRKVMGAARRSLIGQFMSETVLTSLLALVLAMIAVRVSLPVFNNLFDKQLKLDLSEPLTLAGMVGLLIITGVLAGSYPALYLSAQQPLQVLRNKLRSGFSAAFLRRSLVVFQFTLSVFLVIGMLIVARQMQYTLSKNLGLERENILYIPLDGALYTELETFRQEVMNIPAIASATSAHHLPVNIQSSSGDLSWPGRDPDLETNISASSIGYDFIETMGIQLAGGRDFSKEFSTDSTAYLINESAARYMGMDDPVGKQIEFWNGQGPIVGVMRDYHFQSLHSPITPLIFVLNPWNSEYLLVKTRAGKTEEAITGLQRLTRQLNPNYPFEYHFLDDDYEQLYKSDSQVNALIKYFGTLAILISAMGLLALATFTTEQRTKEIGIRKVLGASVAGVVALLSRDFMKLVLVAMLIAFPLAWYVMNRWLGNFAYRIDIEWWMFLAAGLLAIAVAIISVCFQSIKAALANPVRSLRSE